MTEPHPRLRSARIRAGYETAAEFAREFEGIEEGTYQSHENGTRALSIDAAKRYAAAFGEDVTWQWLMFGDSVTVASNLPAPERRTPKMMRIDELDVTAGNADGGPLHEREDDDLHEAVIGRWEMPTSVVRAYTAAPAERIKIITCKGDSNEPVFLPGQRVLVDCADRAPSPPGFFALWDGIGLIIKRLEYLPNSDPPQVVVSSANPDYKPRTELLAGLVINGRVIGKWTWT